MRISELENLSKDGGGTITSGVTQILLDVAMRWSDQPAEQACVLHHCQNAQVWKVQNFHDGKTSRIRLDMKAIISEIASNDSSALILCHSHPGGRCAPSEPDIRATRSISQICRTLEVDLIDHLVFTPRQYFSFRDAGYL